MTIFNPPQSEPDWSKKRSHAFPDIMTQLDMLYWDQVNGTTVWKDTITKIKSDFPIS